MISSSRGPKTPFGGGSGDSARGFFVRADMSSETGEFRVRFHVMVAVDVQALGRLDETGAFIGSSAVFAACLEGEDRVMAAIKFNRSVLRGSLEELKSRDAFIRLRIPSFESRWPQGINIISRNEAIGEWVPPRGNNALRRDDAKLVILI
jgi:hypothetical protein